MKILSIRLKDSDMSRIEDIRAEKGQKTINGALRVALIEREALLQEKKHYIDQYDKLCEDLQELFTSTWQINLKKLEELDKKLFFLPR